LGVKVEATRKRRRGGRKPGGSATEERHMTHAECSAVTRKRDDEHMIYEMGTISQYEDGSVLDCLTMTTYTAEQVVAGITIYPEPALIFNRPKLYLKDLKRNAKVALKNGKTENLAPLVDW
jgi:hypothetical protein